LDQLIISTKEHLWEKSTKLYYQVRVCHYVHNRFKTNQTTPWRKSLRHHDKNILLSKFAPIRFGMRSCFGGNDVATGIILIDHGYIAIKLIFTHALIYPNYMPESAGSILSMFY
jgi:hypothetical protein